MAIYIPGLRMMLTDHTKLLRKKLQPASSGGIINVKESQTFYFLSARVGEAYFDYIAVDYSQNVITFNQAGRGREMMGEAVLASLRELGIREYTLRSMSFSTSSKNEEPN